VIVWTAVVDPHVGVATALVPSVAALALFLSSSMILRHREQPRPAEYAAAWTMIVLGLTQVAAAGLGLLQGAEGDDRYYTLYIHFYFLTLPAGYTGMAMFVILMLASDLSEQMKEDAIRDQLTGLLNRRGFNECSATAYATARRTGRPVSVVMTDIDRFKYINDEFGHAAGDLALCRFAETLRQLRRAEDILARVGGEEFAIVLPGTSVEDANTIAEDLCARVEANTVDLGEGEALPMTASFGVATLSEKDSCLSEAIVRADRALYRSKRAGRNRVDLEASQVLRTIDGELKPI